MPIYHLLLVLLVVVIWGCNFIFIQFSLKEMSPLLLCALRFILASFPAILFIKPPAAPFRIIALYGFLMFGLQFTLLFMGMHAGMSPGLASLLVQTQVFFSIFFAVILTGEKPGVWQILGALIAFSGIALVAMHVNKTGSLLGFIFIISAAASWGLGNLVTKKIRHVNMISLVVWGSFVASIPLIFLTLTFDGTQNIVTSLKNISWLGIASVLYIVYLSTWVGYGVWNWLLSRYNVSAVVPFTLLVPVVAMLSSVLILGEAVQSWKIIAGMLVISGLCINLVGANLFTRVRNFNKKATAPISHENKSALSND